MIDAARTWDDRLSDALVEELGEVQGHELARRYAGLLPDYYKTATEIYRGHVRRRPLRAAGRAAAVT